MITLIAAIDLGGGIGNAGTIPWRAPEDMKRFKALTMGHPIVMGRKTYASIGKPLPGRINVVVSRTVRFINSCVVVPTLETAFILAKQLSEDNEFFVIGGAEIYAQTLAAADQLLLTVVGATYACDAQFPSDLGRDWFVSVDGTVPAQNGHPSLAFLRLEPCADAVNAPENSIGTVRQLSDVIALARPLL
jgi:dihydrofolate reductase